MEIRAENVQITEIQTFLDSLEWLDVPEDPNYDYSPGHYLPFPMATIQIQSDGAFKVFIKQY